MKMNECYSSNEDKKISRFGIKSQSLFLLIPNATAKYGEYNTRVYLTRYTAKFQATLIWIVFTYELSSLHRENTIKGSELPKKSFLSSLWPLNFIWRTSLHESSSSAVKINCPLLRTCVPLKIKKSYGKPYTDQEKVPCGKLITKM